MSVHVTFLGGLGNNLFQYALGRIIAEHHDLELHCTRCAAAHSSPWRLKLHPREIVGLEDLQASFPNAPLHVAGHRIHVPIEAFEMSPGTQWGGQALDLNLILTNRMPRQIRLKGYFQRFEYFAPYTDRIRKWFRPKISSESFRPVPADILVNIRRGIDYGINRWTLPASYYDKLLSSVADLGRVYVCGVGIDRMIRSSLAKYSPTYLVGPPIDNFCSIMRFNRLILSNSTFAWWAAFLSQATEIYAPRTVDGSFYGFAGFRDVDLNMRDSRYLEVDQLGAADCTILVINRPSIFQLNENVSTMEILYDDGSTRMIHSNKATNELLGFMRSKKDPILRFEVSEMDMAQKGALERLLATRVLKATVSYRD